MRKDKERYTHTANEWLPTSIQDDFFFYRGPGNILGNTRCFFYFIINVPTLEHAQYCTLHFLTISV